MPIANVTHGSMHLFHVTSHDYNPADEGRIVETIRRFVPDLELTFVDAAIMNQLSYTVSPDKFRRLGFRYEGDLVAGIRETVERLKNARAARV